jgi:hypothetical protein
MEEEKWHEVSVFVQEFRNVKVKGFNQKDCEEKLQFYLDNLTEKESELDYLHNIPIEYKIEHRICEVVTDSIIPKVVKINKEKDKEGKSSCMDELTEDQIQEMNNIEREEQEKRVNTLSNKSDLFIFKNKKDFSEKIT